MLEVVREYNAKMDAKRRITIRTSDYEYYHVKQYSNGTIVLEPRVIAAPFEVNEGDTAVAGKTKNSVDLPGFEN